MRTLIVDNYDSFTFNLFQMVADASGQRPIVVRNDTPWGDIARLDFDNVVLSPGPGRPEREDDFGICRRLLEEVDVPLLGVCLGHQGLGHAFGGRVVPAPEVMHGRTSRIHHGGDELFANIPRLLRGVRYHSLILAEPLPAAVAKIAWTDDGLVMGVRHRQRPFWGVQFHPESICTEYGEQLLRNFARITESWRPRRVSSRASGHWDASVSVVPSREQAEREESQLGLHVRPLGVYADPELVFERLYAQKPYAFWLDGRSNGAPVGASEPTAPWARHGRFSFMGAFGGPESLRVEYRTGDDCVLVWHPDGTLTQDPSNIFEYLDRTIDRRRVRSPELPFDFNCGLVGYFGYELASSGQPTSRKLSPRPDAQFILADRLIVFDHQERVTYLLALTSSREGGGPPTSWFDRSERAIGSLAGRSPSARPLRVEGASTGDAVSWLETDPERYLSNIAECHRLIAAGETYEVCLTNRLRVPVKVDPLSYYRTLRRMNPAPYSAFLRLGDTAVACSSPERFLRIDRDGKVESKPIKGTCRRSPSAERDGRLAHALEHSEKNRAENLMIVDLLRNDLGLVCEVGSVHVPKLMQIESYATVHQLVSTVRGRLRSDLSAVDAIKAAFPGGSMTGAPKRRTMQIIDSMERDPRGVYSGALGYLGLGGTADLNIVIRTAVITADEVTIGVGGAIVHLSDAREELEEALLKAEALLRAIAVETRAGRAVAVPH